MIEELLGHYRIVERIGEGGMGVVYRAIDTRLGRTVALKVLKPEFIGQSGRSERFLLKAKTASALNHPNILTIHAVESLDHGAFIVMEYVEGKTLQAIMAGQNRERRSIVSRAGRRTATFSTSYRTAMASAASGRSVWMRAGARLVPPMPRSIFTRRGCP